MLIWLDCYDPFVCMIESLAAERSLCVFASIWIMSGAHTDQQHIISVSTIFSHFETKVLNICGGCNGNSDRPYFCFCRQLKWLKMQQLYTNTTCTDFLHVKCNEWEKSTSIISFSHFQTGFEFILEWQTHFWHSHFQYCAKKNFFPCTKQTFMQT